MLDYIRIACGVPAVKPGDVQKNIRDICAFMEKADKDNADILLLPELALSGYTCGDLFFQNALQSEVKKGLAQLVEASRAWPGLTTVVGLPLRIAGKLYNCAGVIARGQICGIVPKCHLAEGESRWFASGKDLNICLEPQDLGLDWGESRYSIDVSTRMLFQIGDAKVGIEICQDLMVPCPPSGELALLGAEVILNPAASAAWAGKAAWRKALVEHRSGSLNCVYAFCSAGATESTQDAVFSGHTVVAENGHTLFESPYPAASDYIKVLDCDLGKCRADRLKNPGFLHRAEVYILRNIHQEALRGDGSLYPVRKYPFIPEEQQDRALRCREIFAIQVAGLRQRLALLNADAVVGISGGLDSTLALLVAVEAAKQLGWPLSRVHGVTMPCFGTSDRTYRNALELMRRLGISCKEVDIREAVSLHFRDIGQDEAVHNTTYENAQARERTQILMDYAGMVGGIVVGTGDLSELALGWCTYNGDHMSMYSVNAAVPKTLISRIIETVADAPAFLPVKEVLLAVVETPISPELLPPDDKGRISQQTEDIVGPYALHDFYLYYVLRWGFSPEKIYALACRAFRETYSGAEIKNWLVNFYRRFFTQQFKRSCMPDGPGVGSVGFSPRTAWHMPSDASARLWLEEAERL